MGYWQDLEHKSTLTRYDIRRSHNWNYENAPKQTPANYAGLGLDVLTDKTVRSRYRNGFDAPNLLPVDASQHTGSADAVKQGPGRPPVSIACF